MTCVSVQTHANIALHKYWGKRDEKLFLPTKSSLAFSVKELTTVTTLAMLSSNVDKIELTWNSHDKKAQERTQQFLNFFRQHYKIDAYFSIASHNYFPTAAGLASSSSGFAALALGLNALCKLNLSESELSIIARHGSGSAARSMFGGFTVWHKGKRDDGADSFAEQLFDEHHWPELCMLIVIVAEQQKKISSREGMRLTCTTSPAYASWLVESEQRLSLLIEAIRKKDFELVGVLVETEWYGMYQAMITTQPSLNYWTKTSFDVMQQVISLRKKGISCFFTTDAGPQIKVLCLRDEVKKIKPLLEQNNEGIKIIVGTNAGGPVLTHFE